MMGTRVPAVLSVGEQSGVPHDPPGSTTPMDLDSVSVEHQQQSQSLQQSQPSARQSPSKRSAGEPSTSTSGTGSGIDSAKPSRRSHPKSRTGCRTCKSRKIKCDEGKPYCNNCKKHGVDCDFLTQSSDPTDLAAPLTPSLASSASLLGADAMAGELNMLDLELMHNFTTATYHTLSTDPVVRDFWRITVVQMALRCPYVMRAMLSVSALHIAHFRPDRRDYYCAAAALHHQRASRAAMQLLSTSFSKEVGRNLYLFSLLTNFYALASPRKSNEDFLLLGETQVPDWLFLLQGTRSITLQLGGDDVTSPHGPLAPIFAHGADRYMAVYGGQPTHGAGPATVQNSSVAGLDDDDTLVGIDSDPTNPSPHAPLPHHRGSVASSASASRHPSVTPTSTQHLLALPTPTDQTSPIHQGRLAQQRLRALDALVRRRVMRIPGATPEARERQQQLLLIYGRAIAELRKSFAVFYASSAATATGAASGEPRGEPSPMMSTSSGSSPSSFGGGAGAEGSGRAGSGGSSASASGNAPLSLDLSDAFVWLFIVADDFLPLLKPSAGPAQEALAIFAHFCILLKRLDGEWWLQGWGTHLILRCHSLLDDEHRLWIRWPIEEAGIVVSSLA